MSCRQSPCIISPSPTHIFWASKAITWAYDIFLENNGGKVKNKIHVWGNPMNEWNCKLSRKVLPCDLTWFMPVHQGISCPSQAKNFPFSLKPTPSMIPRSLWTEYSEVKSLSLGTLRWNGLDRSVSTVPGWSNMQTTGSFLLANSSETVFVTTFINTAYFFCK